MTNIITLMAIAAMLIAQAAPSGKNVVLLPQPAGATIVACSTTWSNFAVDSTGKVTGVPVTPGLCSFSIKVCDSENPSQCSPPTQVTILTPVPVTLVSTTLPMAFVGQSYSQSLQGQGGVGPYFFTQQ